MVDPLTATEAMHIENRFDRLGHISDSLLFTLKCIEKQLTRIADALEMEAGV